MDIFVMNLLTDAGNGSSDNGGGWFNFVLIGILVVAFIVMMIFSSRSNKKKQQEQESVMNSIRPGNKVKTIGGVCGIVVEVNAEENTFVLETGNETNGKCYLKFDKQAVFQTDAKAEKTENKGKEAKSEPAQKESLAENGETPVSSGNADKEEK